MVSIAYGGDQSDSMQLHQPEVCYSSQGFEIRRNVAGTCRRNTAMLALCGDLLAVQGFVASRLLTGWWSATMRHCRGSGEVAQLSYGLTGHVPDGFLVRISSIDRDPSAAYGEH